MTISYWLFVSPSSLKARDPKAVMKIETLNAAFQPAKIGNPCGLQITYLKDNSTRNIFVYHSDAKVSLLIVDNLLFKHAYSAMMLIGWSTQSTQTLDFHVSSHKSTQKACILIMMSQMY